MGTWAVPFATVRSARQFSKRMAAPWLATVKAGDWDAEGLYALVGDDQLFDALGDQASGRSRPFDVRPFVTERVRALLEEVEDSPAVSLVRAALGASKAKKKGRAAAPAPKSRAQGSKLVDDDLKKLKLRFRTLGPTGRAVTHDRRAFVALLRAAGWTRVDAQYLTKDGVRLNLAKVRNRPGETHFFIETDWM